MSRAPRGRPGGARRPAALLGPEAARLWRVKIERCVRFMIAQLPEDDAAPHLWTTPAGKPRLRREEPRGVAH